jgi:hypothetical protein
MHLQIVLLRHQALHPGPEALWRCHALRIGLLPCCPFDLVMGWLLRVILLRLLCAAPAVKLSTTLARLSCCSKCRFQVTTGQLLAPS